MLRVGSRPSNRRGPTAIFASSHAESTVEASETGDTEIEIPERPAHVRTTDGFLGATAAEALRGVFDARHADPTRVHEYRFVWDYWHVPDQYTLLRTPAADYFPKEQYDALAGRRTHRHEAHPTRVPRVCGVGFETKGSACKTTTGRRG